MDALLIEVYSADMRPIPTNRGLVRFTFSIPRDCVRVVVHSAEYPSIPSVNGFSRDGKIARGELVSEEHDIVFMA
jgi:hypothetical protein